MSEAEWCTADPQRMLKSVRGKVGERKLRLFCVACCRRIWHLINDRRARQAVEVAERYADGQATEEERLQFSNGNYFEATQLSSCLMSATGAAGWAVSRPLTVLQAANCAVHAEHAAWYNATDMGVVEEVADREGNVFLVEHSSEMVRTEQVISLRDVFGNPFRPIALDPSWRTTTVTALAQAIYDERAFDRMPTLGDALKDAGCTNADILAHCREPVEHVRGCWVVDLVLGHDAGEVETGMTEEKWLACNDPRPMLDVLRGRVSDRKLRLFAIACFRRDWTLYTDERSRESIVVGERYADGKATATELKTSHDAAMQAAREITDAAFMPFGTWRTDQDFEENNRRISSSLAANDAAWGSAMAATSRRRIQTPGAVAEARAEAVLLRDIFGNPFRPVTLDPSWLAWNDGTIPRLAQAIYSDRRFADLPILADALEEAACTNGDILAHCRSGGEHVRGCWVVDLLLGKE